MKPGFFGVHKLKQFIHHAQPYLSIMCRSIGLSESDAKMYSETVMLSFDTNSDKVLTKEEFINGCLHDSTLGRLANPFQF